MVGTVGAARRIAITQVSHVLGLALGSAAVFGGLALLGQALDPPPEMLFVFVGVAAAAALADLGGFAVRPRIRSQVPERWRWTMPLSRALLLYGILLGTGVFTYMPAAAGWALLGLSFGLGSWVQGLVIGLALAAGRALPVLVLARRSAGDVLAELPEGLRIVRMLAAVTLAAAIAASVAGSGSAATRIAVRAEDPSTAGSDLVWQRPRAGGFLRRGGKVTRLPGSDPAVGGARIAWHSSTAITIADRTTLQPLLQIRATGAEKLAVSDEWLVYLRRSGRYARLLAPQLADPKTVRPLSTRHRIGELGRPALDGHTVVFHVATGSGSSIRSVDLSSGRQGQLRFSRTIQYLNPSLLDGQLLYVRVSRCSQDLRTAPHRRGRGRTLYSLPPPAGQDVGHERKYAAQGGGG